MLHVLPQTQRQEVVVSEATLALPILIMHIPFSWWLSNVQYFLGVRSVDATKSGRIGRLINHSRLSPNLRTRLFSVDGVPRLGLCAIKDIEKGTELHYDYGERDPQALAAHPWLKS